MDAFSSHKAITFSPVSLPHEYVMETNSELWGLVVLWLHKHKRYICIFTSSLMYETKNSPEVEKSSGPFETSLKETSLDFPNKASLWRGKSTFSPCWWKNRHPNETEHAQTTLTFIKEILTLNDK